MNRFILPAASLLLALALTSPTASQTSPCPLGNTRNTAYMLRKGDQRCEGITTPNVSRSGVALQSFTIGPLKDSPTLSLTIPKLTNLPEPRLRVQSTAKHYYQLDPRALKDAGNQWRFQWPNTVLRQANIPLSDLRSLAEGGSEGIVLPVRFSPSPSYDIRIHTGNRTKTISLKILDAKGSPIYTATKTDQPGTEVAFTWNGRTPQNKPAPAGRYTLRVEAEVEQPNAPAERRQTTRQFDHNSTWLQ